VTSDTSETYNAYLSHPFEARLTNPSLPKPPEPKALDLGVDFGFTISKNNRITSKYSVWFVFFFFANSVCAELDDSRALVQGKKQSETLDKGLRVGMSEEQIHTLAPELMSDCRGSSKNYKTCRGSFLISEKALVPFYDKRYLKTNQRKNYVLHFNKGLLERWEHDSD